MSTFDKNTLKKKVEATIENYKKNLSTIKTRVSGDILDAVIIEAYGDKKPLSSIASITVRGQELWVTSWDKSLTSAIVKGIQKSDLNLNPISEPGDLVRVPLPIITTEYRSVLAKSVEHKAEEAKVAVRNVRRHEMDVLKAQQKSKEISEDECKRNTKEVESIISDAIATVEDLCSKKSKEVLSM